MTRHGGQAADDTDVSTEWTEFYRMPDQKLDFVNSVILSDFSVLSRSRTVSTEDRLGTSKRKHQLCSRGLSFVHVDCKCCVPPKLVTS